MQRKKYLVFALICTLFLMNFSAGNINSEAASKYKWSNSIAPNYVKVIGKAKVSSKPKKGNIKYSALDKYGRARRVVGNITYAMVKKSAGWREAISEDPAGWPCNNPITTIKLYNGRSYRGYLWNRSHLIADSLGGEASVNNLITGTRMQNVGANDGQGGMAYTERKAVNWLYNHHNGTVYYSANPVYYGKEIIPRSVIVDIKTSDQSINERVIVYNAAKGFKINYSNPGKTKAGSASSVAKKKAKKKSKKKTSKAKSSKKSTKSGKVYVTATGTKYHCNKNCRGLSNARKLYKVSKKSAKSDGLKPCKICY